MKNEVNLREVYLKYFLEDYRYFEEEELDKLSQTEMREFIYQDHSRTIEFVGYLFREIEELVDMIENQRR